MADQPAADASPPRRLTVVPPHPDAPAPPLPPADTGQPHTRDTDDGNKVALVHAAYAAGGLTTEQATEMIAALPGREETAVEYGWRADLVLAGLVMCGGCGCGLIPDMTAGVVTFACPADGCGLVRVAARR